MEFRLERGADPARTDAPAHGRFRISLRDKCGDEMGGEKETLNVIKRDAQAENLQKGRERKAALLVFTALRAPAGLPVRARAREARVEFCINRAISRGDGCTQTNTHSHTHTRLRAAYISL